MATSGGNLSCSEPAALYFYDDAASRCNKRDPPVPAATPIDGFNRNHAILGASPAASPPIRRTCAWPWRRFDAVVTCRRTRWRTGRSLLVNDLHRLPGERPERGNRARCRRTDHRGDAAGLAFSLRVRPIARCATGRATPLRWCRWPPAWTCRRTGRFETFGWRWAVSPTSPGGPRQGRGRMLEGRARQTGGQFRASGRGNRSWRLRGPIATTASRSSCRGA